ncbi:hypothetical protein [Streptomyces triticiradicis]|uniref:Uncharacterized protein n=1 Tax=Streptomyces triticiradicis TaxID=2651189 RepID=A0A7J5DIC9_9ACTN|nr:hypothetical protein [Streptomyces triticiradicis]KAB1988437.1 hypothetical protein F8144_12435 [Streptomyces triticiradicis]
MRSGNSGRPTRPRTAWTGAEVNLAAAICAAQFAVVVAVRWVGTFDDDHHGAGLGGVPAAVGLLCVLVLGPPLLAALGLLHTVACTMPAATLARLARRRAPGPEGAWHTGFVLLLGTFWAALAVALPGPAPTGAEAVLLAVSGVPPALGLARARRRERATGRPPEDGRVRLRSALVALGLCALVAAAGAAGLATGLIREYEPPKLGADRLTGVWRGDHGAVLRLRTDGRAELSAVPAQPEFGDVTTKEFTRCDGVGKWFLDTAGRYDPYADGTVSERRDGVVVRVGDCGHDTYWTIGGTEARPELFVLFGDPDAGDLRILRRG